MKRIIAGLILAIVATAAPCAFAQRSLELHPTTSLIQKPDRYLSANGIHIVAASKASIDAKATAATNVFTVPTPSTGTFKFYCTGIKVETTAATAITAGAAITVGSTGTAANSLLASTTLANTPVVNGCESFSPKAGALVLASGDVVTVTVATGATGTSQALTVHLSGFLR
jgi:hypothetical protein